MKDPNYIEHYLELIQDPDSPYYAGSAMYLSIFSILNKIHSDSDTSELHTLKHLIYNMIDIDKDYYFQLSDPDLDKNLKYSILDNILYIVNKTYDKISELLISKSTYEMLLLNLVSIREMFKFYNIFPDLTAKIVCLKDSNKVSPNKEENLSYDNTTQLKIISSLLLKLIRRRLRLSNKHNIPLKEIEQEALNILNDNKDVSFESISKLTDNLNILLSYTKSSVSMDYKYLITAYNILKGELNK